MKRLLSALSLVVGLCAAVPAAAQFQKPEDAIKYRQGAFTVMANHLGRVGAMAAGRAPFDAKVAAENTAIVATMAALPFAGFVEGSDKGLPNRAKAEIWSNNAKFKDLAGKMEAEITKLDAAAKSGNLDSIKAAMGSVGGSCKACHDDFRAERYSAN
ncbi:MAG TPA: cytochrome c [Rubrivivax sp.]|nr:cytochrome c [Rubrivivax sp.]